MRADWQLWMAFDPMWSPQWVLLGYATVLRGTAVLVVLAAAALLVRRGSAAARAGLWACALLAVLPIPAVRRFPVVAPVVGRLAWRAHVVPAPLATPMVATGATMVAQSWPGAARVPWTSWVGIAWATGAGVVLLRLAWGCAALAALARRARPVDDPAWAAALDDARDALGIGRRVRLLQAPDVATPLTWGTLRPTVLVPDDAQAWPAAHRRAVLLHELAHVRRLDCLLGLLGHVSCAVWWCHPGVWWAAHRLRLERERACDERVLRAGVRASDYAECLLRIADRSRAGPPLGPAVVAAGLVRRAQLHDRLRAILTPGTARGWTRGRVPGRLAPAATALAGLALVASAGTVRLAPRPAVLWTALASPAWTTRATAAEGIARYGDAGAVARLHAVLAHERDPRVRAMARFGRGLRDPALGDGAPFGWPPPRRAR